MFGHTQSNAAYSYQLNAMGQDRVIGDLAEQLLAAEGLNNHKHEFERRETPMCPSCGYNLRSEKPLLAGDFYYDPRGVAMWKGRPIELTSQQHMLLGSLIQANGRIVTRETLINRINEDACAKQVDVVVCNLKKRLSAAGAPKDLVANVWGKGFRFNNPVPEKKPTSVVVMGHFPTVRRNNG
jgi:DNA-binding response OmpR family regulator